MAGLSSIETELLSRIEKTLTSEMLSLTGFYDTLVEADAMLKAIIPYFSPPHTRPVLPSTGNPEFGAIPYWAKNPDKIPYSDDIPQIALDIIKLLDDFGFIPPPTITDDEYSSLVTAAKNGTAIAFDGTSFGINAFEQLDYNWLQAPVNALLTIVHYHKAPFGNNAAAILPIVSGTQTFAVTGDWGTAATQAKDVRAAAMNLSPDYLIHLGDVYYTGTPKTSEALLFWGQNDEVNNLVNFWPSSQMLPGRSFTMNSNHEMYPGGIGLFQDALTNPIFKHQNGKSYFMLQNDYWQIFALDSAYYSPDFLYMYGALTDGKNNEQIEFVQKNLDPKKRTILMTHHTPYDVTGQEEEIKDGVSLLQQVTEAFGGLPDYWYFGHIHDGIVYETKNGCNMRCAGHASMPFGAPWGLTKPGSEPPFSPSEYIDGIKFFAGTPQDEKKPAGLVKNGFMTFTLDKETITETFYDSDGCSKWTSS